MSRDVVSRVGALVPTKDAPAESLRLIDLLGADFAARGSNWGKEICERLRREARSGELPGVLFVGPKDDAVGLAWRSPDDCELGVRANFYLAPGYRSIATIAAFAELLEGAGGLGPVVSFGEPWPGARAEECLPPLAERGFTWVERVGMQFPSERPLPVPRASEATVRPITAEDESALIRLQLSTYEDDPVERALFVRYRDRWADAEYGIRALLGSGLGPFVGSASFAIPAEHGLAAATMVNELDGQLITEVMTHPEHRRRGYAERLLAETLRAIRHGEGARPRLMVTRQNARARTLYERLGFEPVPGDSGGVFLHLARLETPALTPETLRGPRPSLNSGRSGTPRA